MVKHYGFSALEAIAWLRLCRPGSVIGHQQRWLEEKQEMLWAEGEKYRKRHNLSEPTVHECGIYSNYAQQYVRDKMNGISNQVRMERMRREYEDHILIEIVNFQVNNINLNDESSSLDAVNNNGSSCNDSNNNNNEAAPVEPEEEEEQTQEQVKSSATDAVSRRSSPPKPPPRLKSARVAAATATPTSTATTTVKTQGDELNEIKATRRRHTRSHNLDHS